MIDDLVTRNIIRLIDYEIFRIGDKEVKKNFSTFFFDVNKSIIKAHKIYGSFKDVHPLDIDPRAEIRRIERLNNPKPRRRGFVFD